MLKALLGVGISWILILGFTWLGMNLNSRPWSERTVPSVEGLMQDSAIQVLEDLDLQPVHLDSVFNASAIPGAVLEQSPAAGSNVKSGRPVYLTTFRFKLRVKTEANTELDGKVVRIEHRGISLGPEERLQRGSSITLIIGEVLNKQVRIPWLIGLNLRDATKRLSNSALSVGYVEYGDSLFTRNDTLNALVVSQFPKSSAGFVKAGTAIDLFLEKP